MANPKNKLEFDPGALGPLLKKKEAPTSAKSAVSRRTAAPAPAQAAAAPAVQDTPDGPVAAEASQAPGTARRGPGRPRTKVEGPVATSYDIDADLRKRVQSAKADFDKKGQRGYSYARIILEAISTHAEALSTHWAAAEQQAPTTGLFAQRLSQPPRQSRTNLARLYVSGLSVDEHAQLVRLVEEWGAPDMGSLVEEALQRQYPAPGKGKGRGAGR